MPESLEATVNLIDQKVRFKGKSRSNPEIILDYFPPLGEGQGYTGLELLLVSLAGCSGTAVVALLRQMDRSISGFEVKAKGIRCDQHPTSFHTIFLEFVLNSVDADDTHMQKAIQMSEESICPVWAMLKNNVDIKPTYKIIAH